MNKYFYILFVLILGCSLNSDSAFWSKSTKIKTDKTITKVLFKDVKPNEDEFNPKLIINLPKVKIKNTKGHILDLPITQIEEIWGEEKATNS